MTNKETRDKATDIEELNNLMREKFSKICGDAYLALVNKSKQVEQLCEIFQQRPSIRTGSRVQDAKDELVSETNSAQNDIVNIWKEQYSQFVPWDEVENFVNSLKEKFVPR